MLNCPACNSSETNERIFLYNDKSRVLQQCINCGHAFDKEYRNSNQGYASGEYGLKDGKIPNFDRDLKLARTFITSHILKPGDSVLDCGAGWGGLPLRISQISQEYSLGIKVNCFEPVAHLANSIADRDSTIKIYSDMNHCEKNDFVIAKEVIEHTNDPKAFLEQLSRSMKVGASLLITCPGHSNALKEKPGCLFDYQIRNHLHFFTKKSLEALIKRTGLFDFSFVALLDQYPDHAKHEYTDNDKCEEILRMLSRRVNDESGHLQALLCRRDS